jgi:hypothetical protein
MQHRLSFSLGGLCFSPILVASLAFVQSAAAIVPINSNPSTDVPALDFEVPRDKVHLSAQALQAIYLKGGVLFLQKAAGSAKEATCLLSLWFTGDGMIQAAQ